MSSSSTSQWPPRRPSKRSKLRNGTFIIPGTGERSRRQFSLRTSSLEDPSEDPDGYHSMVSQETMGERLDVIKHNAKTTAWRFWDWLNSSAGRGVLKCTLAYLLGSMATFLSPVSDFLGKPDGKHIVATLTVYFHASRTWGSMVEAVIISIIAVTYGEIISLMSMGVSVLFGTQFGMQSLAHALILILFIGGGLGFIGWVKQRMNSPLVNVGSTLASIAIISVVTKEDSVQGGEFSAVKIVQVLKMLAMGISITAFVNILVWRVSARSLLRQSMNNASVSLGDMLSMITRGFLNGSEEELLSGEFNQAVSNYKSIYSKMTSNLREAKLEHYVLGREKTYALDKSVVKSLESLSQEIGGLRSAANTQFALLKEMPTDAGSGAPLSPGSTVFTPTLTRAMSNYLKTAKDRFATLSAIDESDEHEPQEQTTIEQALEDPSIAPPPMFRMPSEIFELFIALLGPSMKSLAFTLSEILRDPVFGASPDYKITINQHFKQSLRDALNLYDNARGNALHELYNSIELGRSRSEKVQADIEEVAAACGHFSFSLQSVAEDIDGYLTVLEDLKYTRELSRRSWNWLKIWELFHWNTRLPSDDPDRETLLEPPEPPVRAIRKTAVPRGIPDTMVQQRDTFSWNAAPNASRFIRAASQRLLKMLRVLGREDIRFGIKVGIGAIAWAAFAFVPATRPTYQHWRGEWGLLSYMIVVSMTVGAANTTGTARFLGTLIGASLAMGAWAVSQGNAVVLAFLGWLVSFCSFYVMLVIGNGPLGRITLLAWNVTVLYAYSLSQRVEDDDDDELDEGGKNPLMFEICYHRVISVTLGIMWGIIVCRAIWPISGRRKFKEGLAVLYLQLGLIWRRGPLAILLKSDNRRSYIKAGEQEALQRYAFKLETLRNAAKSEFELRGPFPDEAYGRIMQSTNKILDGFHAMRLVTQKRGHLSEGERALLEYTAPERALLCDRICHVFQVLASSMMLEYPLTDAIPSVMGNKDRLLGKVYHFRKTHPGQKVQGQQENEPPSQEVVVANERDYALLYAYTLVTAQVAHELETVQKEIEALFGVLHEESLLLQ